MWVRARACERVHEIEREQARVRRPARMRRCLRLPPQLVTVPQLLYMCGAATGGTAREGARGLQPLLLVRTACELALPALSDDSVTEWLR